jgi:3-oxoacyl-[acyl-carrier-protein] synthase-3
VTPVSGRASGLPVAIRGTGSVTGSLPVTSTELDERHGRTPGTTAARSGVTSRYWAGPGQTSSSLATDAIATALDAAGWTACDLDALIVASVLPEQPMPTTAALVTQRLGRTDGGLTAFDVNASCLGFLTALDLAGLAIAAGRWRRVAIAAVDIASPGLDHDNLESSALFGDGAAACVLEAATGPAAILATRSAIYPSGARLCEIAAGGTRWNATLPPPVPTDYLFRMDGLGVMRLAAKHLPGFVAAVLDDAGLALDEVDVVVPHQASGLGLRYLRERLGAPADRVVDILADHGNQVSASLPTALDHAVRAGRLGPGRTALLLGTGAGLVISAAVVRFE